MSSTKISSPKSPKSPKSSKTSIFSRNSNKSYASLDDKAEDYYTTPEFIYGGPFIAVKKPSPFMDTATPMNLQLQGTFKKSFAYFSLKDRLPVILTKIIDSLSRDGSKIKSATGASDEDIKLFMQYVAKLKNDLVTNKTYDHLKLDTPNSNKWNTWIDEQENKKYFNNIWVFSECYVYRRLKEGCELTKNLKNYDFFGEQKNKSFDDNVMLMCMVADRLVTMLPKSEKDKRKQDFITLLKIALWSNKCDLSLSLGEQVELGKEKEAPEKPVEVKPPPPPPTEGKTKGKGGKDKDKDKAAAAAGPKSISFDPFQMVIDLKDKLLVDDSAKIADQVVTKAENMAKAINANTTFKAKCSCHRLATLAGVSLCKEEARPPPPPEPKEKEKEKGKGKGKEKEEVKEEEKESAVPPAETEAEVKEEAPKQIPCPAKMTIPQAVMFDIVCDNSGYELFADLCIAHFLVAQKIVQKVRFHVKNQPWFVSDVTESDFHYLLDQCTKSTFSKELPSDPKPEPAEGEAAEDPKKVTADNLKTLGEQWKQFVEDGTFVVMAEDFWTYPLVYKDMKKHDYNMYRKLQYAVAVLFKGDLNYRKLLAERNCNPSLGFEAALQGFMPAPIIALRTVKSDLICGLPKGKWDALNKIDEKWMQTGDYGVIQYCPKGEPLKVADRPCLDYCQTCFGVICPEHTDM